MTTDDVALSPDATLLLDEARALVASIGPDTPPGDFTDVVRRAALLRDAMISEQDIEESEAFAAHDDDEIAAAIRFGTLDDFLDDAAEFVAEQHVDEPPVMGEPMVRAEPSMQVVQAEPAMRVASVVRAEPAARSPRGWVALVASLAAVFLLVPALAGSIWVAQPLTSAEVAEYASASARAHTRPASGFARPAPDPKRSARPSAKGPAPAPLERSIAAAPSSGAIPEGVAPERVVPSPPPGKSKEERLSQLDAEARAAWKQGDLAGAQSKLEALVRTGGRRTIVDIAYGDLFSLARERGDRAALLRHWARYVKRFPHGRYVDEARAGLCREASAAEQRTCWRAYLADRPQGTYRAHAQDVLARGE